MTLKLKEKYCDEESLATIINGLADAIFKDYPKAAGLALIGILKGGAPVADMIAARIEHKYGLVVPVAYVDITLYRDDVIDTLLSIITNGGITTGDNVDANDVPFTNQFPFVAPQQLARNPGVVDDNTRN